MLNYSLLAALVLIIILYSTLIYFYSKREQKYKNIIRDQNNYIKKISDIIVKSKNYLQKLDEKGVLQSDDEIGFFFEQMKSIQLEINNYILDVIEKDGKAEKE